MKFCMKMELFSIGTIFLLLSVGTRASSGLIDCSKYSHDKDKCSEIEDDSHHKACQYNADIDKQQWGVLQPGAAEDADACPSYKYDATLKKIDDDVAAAGTDDHRRLLTKRQKQLAEIQQQLGTSDDINFIPSLRRVLAGSGSESLDHHLVDAIRYIVLDDSLKAATPPCGKECAGLSDEECEARRRLAGGGGGQTNAPQMGGDEAFAWWRCHPAEEEKLAVWPPRRAIHGYEMRMQWCGQPSTNRTTIHRCADSRGLLSPKCSGGGDGGHPLTNDKEKCNQTEDEKGKKCHYDGIGTAMEPEKDTTTATGYVGWCAPNKHDPWRCCAETWGSFSSCIDPYNFDLRRCRMTDFTTLECMIVDRSPAGHCIIQVTLRQKHAPPTVEQIACAYIFATAFGVSLIVAVGFRLKYGTETKHETLRRASTFASTAHSSPSDPNEGTPRSDEEGSGQYGSGPIIKAKPTADD